MVVGHGIYEPGFVLERFDAQGTALGPQVVLSPNSSLASRDVTIDAAGTHVMSWTDTEVDAWASSVDGQRLDGPFRVNADTTGTESGVALAATRAGRAVAVWSSTSPFGADASGSSIRLRMIDLFRFYDGFETGDLSRWTVVVP